MLSRQMRGPGWHEVAERCAARCKDGRPTSRWLHPGAAGWPGSPSPVTATATSSRMKRLERERAAWPITRLPQRWQILPNHGATAGSTSASANHSGQTSRLCGWAGSVCKPCPGLSALQWPLALLAECRCCRLPTKDRLGCRPLLERSFIHRLCPTRLADIYSKRMTSPTEPTIRSSALPRAFSARPRISVPDRQRQHPPRKRSI
jgi:hypothetical protein